MSLTETERLERLRDLRSMGGTGNTYSHLLALPKAELEAIKTAASMPRASIKRLAAYADRLWENTGRMAA